MANTVFQIKRSVIPGRIPSADNLQIGEIAINLTDKKIFSKHSLGDIVTLSDYELSNSAYNISLSGFNQANSAYEKANSAYGVANIAFTIASNLSNTIISLTANTTNNSANQIFDEFSTSMYRSVKYFIQITSSNNYQVSELTLLHDNVTSYITEYGLINTGTSLASYNTNVVDGNVRLLVTPTNNINTIKVIKTVIPI